jgi:broad specificity phosphatase PhoE
MNYTIILRHGERQKINRVEDTESANLILKGVINSILMGLFLRNNYSGIKRIKTSYIKRCYDTAVFIKKGYALFEKIDIIRARDNGALESSGYVKEKHFWDWVTHQKTNKLNWRQFEEKFNELSKKGWCNYSTLKDYTKDFMKENLLDENVLIVTHDTTLVPLLIGLGKIHKINNLPKPLTGIVIHHEKGEIQKVELIQKGEIQNI